MTEWISVKDRLPQKDDKVLLLFDGAIYVGGLESGNNFFLCDTLGLLSTKNVTHWMPLPELPKSKELLGKQICRTCKYWCYNGVDCGRCNQIIIATGARSISGEHDVYKAFFTFEETERRRLYTSMDFGCVRWKEKPKGPFYVSESCGCLGIKHENGQGFYFSSARKVDIEAVVSWINHHS